MYWIGEECNDFTKRIKHAYNSENRALPKRTNLLTFMTIDNLVDKPEPYFVKGHYARIRCVIELGSYAVEMNNLIRLEMKGSIG